jgi:hypothetical protein
MSTEFDPLVIIPQRASWRTYDGSVLADEPAEKLRASLADLPPTPFGNRVTVDLLTDFDAKSRGVEKLGTYGMIRGARNYLVGRVAEADRAFEDFGFAFEWSILQATHLGLGTCWLGGTLKRGAFAKAVGAERSDIIPAVSPVGKAKPKRRMVDRVVRWSAGSARRKDPSELFFSGSFAKPAGPNEQGSYARVLELLRLAPSASNKQPWRVLVSSGAGRFDLYLHRSKGYHRFTSVDLQRIDMGIAMCHFQLAAQALDLPGSWTADPSPDSPALPERTEFVASWLPA